MMQSKTIAILSDTTSHFNYCSSLFFEFENDERVIEASFEIIIAFFILNHLFKASVISRTNN